MNPKEDTELRRDLKSEPAEEEIPIPRSGPVFPAKKEGAEKGESGDAAAINRKEEHSDAEGNMDGRQPTTFQDLPNKILEMVFSLLPVEDLALRVRQVCQRWRDILDEGGVFTRLIYAPRVSQAEEKIISVVRAAPRLRRVYFGYWATPTLLQAVCETCKDLRQITLGKMGLPMLNAIVDACPRLESVDILSYGVENCLGALGRCRSLKQLCLAQLEVPKGALSAIVEGCPELERLVLVTCTCDPEELSCLLEKRGAGLVSFHFRCCYGARCLLPLVSQHCTALRDLYVCHHGPSGALAQLFSSTVASGLRLLHLEAKEVDREATALLFRNCQRLTTLGIYCPPMIDDALIGVSQLAHLQFLDLSCCITLTDSGVARATQGTTLKKVVWHLASPKTHLCCENLPDLRSLIMSKTVVSSELLLTVPHHLKNLKNLIVFGDSIKKAMATIKEQMPDQDLLTQKRMRGPMVIWM